MKQELIRAATAREVYSILGQEAISFYYRAKVLHPNLKQNQSPKETKYKEAL